MLTTQEKTAYCAAVLETKGTMFLGKGTKKTRAPYVQVRVETKEIIERFQGLFEGGCQYKKTLNRYTWSVMNRRAVESASVMKPYMRINRRIHSVELLEQYKFFDGFKKVSKVESDKRWKEAEHLCTLLKNTQKKRNRRILFNQKRTLQPTDTDWAYLAGVLDASGWIRNIDTKSQGAVIDFTTSDPEIVRWLWNFFGGSVTISKDAEKKTRPRYSWKVGVRESKQLSDKIIPLMLNQEKIKLLEYWQTHKMPRPKAKKEMPSRWGEMFK